MSFARIWHRRATRPGDPGSPAWSAGVRGWQSLRFVTSVSGYHTSLPEGGDVILGVDGRTVTSPLDLTEYLRDERRPGDTVRLDLLRDGVPWTAQVVLGWWPARVRPGNRSGTWVRRPTLERLVAGLLPGAGQRQRPSQKSSSTLPDLT